MSVWKAIKWILLTPVILIALGIAYCEANKAYWDHRVRELCQKEGSIKIFEHIVLTRTEYEAMEKSGGRVFVPPKKMSLGNSRYALYYDRQKTVIKRPNPNVWAPLVGKTEVSIIRKSDNKLIAKYSRFYRIGGDFITGILPDSHYGCPISTDDMINSIFSIKED
ncbi:MAG: hypothetical protein KBG75_02165 [Pseudomonadales bacterium]|nr:hypothetical protein [Pseudomonadales bacterium]